MHLARSQKIQIVWTYDMSLSMWYPHACRGLLEDSLWKLRFQTPVMVIEPPRFPDGMKRESNTLGVPAVDSQSRAGTPFAS